MLFAIPLIKDTALKVGVLDDAVIMYFEFVTN